MLATRDAVDGLESRVDQIYGEVKKLRGIVHGFERWRKRDAEAEPEATDTPSPDIAPPGPRNVQPSAQLSRRFRSF